jgi:alpha,alpha-trehalose phosphorylase
VREIADRKQALVERMLAREGVSAFPGAVAWVRSLRQAGVRTAVVSSSANCGGVLRAAGIAGLFDRVVDGGDIARLGLDGKPAPDGFLEAARQLSVAPRRAVVVEDAVAGVVAGRAGEFGLVIGVSRGAGRDALHAAGAHLVVDDLQELAP